MAVVVLLAAVGNFNGNQAAALAARAGAALHILGGMKGEALAAKAMIRTCLGITGEEVAHLRCPLEVGLVEGLEIVGAIQLDAALVEHRGCPSCGAAIAAVHHGQMGAGFRTGEIIRVAQLGLLFHRSHHALELSEPELLAQVHPGHGDFLAADQAGGAAGMGDQGEQAFEQQHPVGAGETITEAELARKAFEQLFN